MDVLEGLLQLVVPLISRRENASHNNSYDHFSSKRPLLNTINWT